MAPTENVWTIHVSQEILGIAFIKYSLFGKVTQIGKKFETTYTVLTFQVFYFPLFTSSEVIPWQGYICLANSVKIQSLR